MAHYKSDGFDIGKVVWDLRNRKEYTRAEIQTMTHGKIKNSWLSHLEKGMIKFPPPAKMDTLASALDTTTLEIYKSAKVLPPDSSTDFDSDERKLVQLLRSMPDDERTRATKILYELAGAEYTSSDTTIQLKRKNAKSRIKNT